MLWSIDFSFFFDFGIGFRNCSDIEVVFVFFILLHKEFDPDFETFELASVAVTMIAGTIHPVKIENISFFLY